MEPLPLIITPYGPLEPEELACILETTTDYVIAEFVLEQPDPTYFALSLQHGTLS